MFLQKSASLKGLTLPLRRCSHPKADALHSTCQVKPSSQNQSQCCLSDIFEWNASGQEQHKEIDTSCFHVYPGRQQQQARVCLYNSQIIAIIMEFLRSPSNSKASHNALRLWHGAINGLAQIDLGDKKTISKPLPPYILLKPIQYKGGQKLIILKMQREKK